ncbi:hypothetical protein JIG36_14120 [Actinoplanes sp. LDG1-06]|uniref:Uncharacterized protein n=1 Tax=Paractinoplanes ovalisporus TaxID=2810368 RepID=A0ABS2AA52_9ACTN|nr:hypothetical protein [Actinoplanes ovalisporus]MBM2616697.1 hypothetical protein [Actinoplanes ovalisporus]
MSVILAATSLTVPAVSASAAPAGTAARSAARFVAAPAGTRAMWLWGAYDPAEVIAWAGAQNVTEVFAYVPWSVATDGSLPRLRDLSERAADAGIRLSALGGEPDWTTNPDDAIVWRDAVLATGLFSAIHLDVEPYALPAWTTDTAATQLAFLTLLDRMRAGNPLPIEADVPFWYGEHKLNKKNFADEVLKRVDAVTVMSYRDTATGTNSMVAVSQDWLRRGATARKRVRLAAETDALAECTYCTFAEEGSRKMLKTLSQVDKATRSSPAYAGIAVHRYGAWRVLRP